MSRRTEIELGLRQAIERHRQANRPSARRLIDLELYRALGLGDPELGIVPHPPKSTLLDEQSYFGTDD